MELGIASFGAYIPRYRLKRSAIAAAHRWMSQSRGGAAKGHRAFCSWDEDALTMAVEAGRDCLRGVDAASVGSLSFASTTHPYADMQNCAIVASALSLPDTIAVTDIGGSQRAATTALIAGLSGGHDGMLLVAADKPPAKPGGAQEMSYGAGAAAMLLGKQDLVARVLGHATVTSYFVDRFRAADAEFDYAWEERWVRDEGYGKIVPRAVRAALENAALDIGDITHFVMPSLVRGAARFVAGSLGFRGNLADELSDECGHAGVAHPFLMLARVLESAEAGERIMLVGFGQGADAVVLEATGRRIGHPAWRGAARSLADNFVTEDYLRMLSFYGNIDLEWGMRSEKVGKAALTEAYRSDHQLSSFRAGKCGRCGTVQFPQLAYCVNPACRAASGDFEAIGLADEPANILTFTADWLSYHPSPPLYVGFVQFRNGARLLMEMVDAPAEAIDVGVPLRMVFRIKERDHLRGFNRYFWKATPINL